MGNRIGIFGGTFDPIHLGHLHLSEVAVKKLNLEKVVFFPTGKVVFKDESKISPFFIRYKFVKKTIKNYSKFQISSADNIKNQISYTSKLLKRIMENGNEYFLLIGEDIVEGLKDWNNFQWIIENVKIVVFSRKGKYSLKDLDYIEKLKFIKMKPINISSTNIRTNPNLYKDFIPLATREDVVSYYSKRIESDR